MIIFAILVTIAAFVWSIIVMFANGMRSSPGEFQGAQTIAVAWCIAGVIWLAWWFG